MYGNSFPLIWFFFTVCVLSFIHWLTKDNKVRKGKKKQTSKKVKEVFMAVFETFYSIVTIFTAGMLVHQAF